MKYIERLQMLIKFLFPTSMAEKPMSYNKAPVKEA